MFSSFGYGGYCDAASTIPAERSYWLIEFGAASKRRSSICLLGPVRRVAALELGANMQIYLVLVPSKFNPADNPSRGCRRTKRRPVGSRRCASSASPATAWDESESDLWSVPSSSEDDIEASVPSERQLLRSYPPQCTDCRGTAYDVASTVPLWTMRWVIFCAGILRSAENEAAVVSGRQLLRSYPPPCTDCRRAADDVASTVPMWTMRWVIFGAGILRSAEHEAAVSRGRPLEHD